IAAQRAERVARDAGGVDADEDVLGPVDLAAHKREMLLARRLLLVEMQRELAVLGRQLGRDEALDELLVAAPVFDQIADCDHLEPVLFREARQLRHARHCPVRIQDLAEYTGRRQPRKTREVDRGLRVSGADQDAALLGSKGEDMSWT